MRSECHAHLIMDGLDYKKAISCHEAGVRDEVIRPRLEAYQRRGITFVRDGGDAKGVSLRARELAGEYGIDYRTPAFAIHKKGHYGAIVGRGFEDVRDYRSLVGEAADAGADFIKIMTTGIMEFGGEGQVTGTPLAPGLVREMVHIAHEEGFAVMCHVNGAANVEAALDAGVDSVEHGNYMDETALRCLAESSAVWVPTLVTVRNLVGEGRYENSVLLPIQEQAEENLRRAFRLGAKVACGSDAGAYRVPHGEGVLQEEEAFFQILGETEAVRAWMQAGNQEIRRRFCRR